MLVYQRVSSKTIKNRDGKFSGWRKSDQLWPVHWASVELSQVSTLLQLGNRPHPPGGRQKPWRDMPRPRGRKHKHCYCCSISDAVLGWKILDYSDYSYTFLVFKFDLLEKKKKRHFARVSASFCCYIWGRNKTKQKTCGRRILAHLSLSENSLWKWPLCLESTFDSAICGSSSSMVAKSSPQIVGLDEWVVNWPCLGMVEFIKFIPFIKIVFWGFLFLGSPH